MSDDLTMENDAVTVASLMAEANRLVNYIRSLGYDGVNLYNITIDSMGKVVFDISCHDDFQRGLPYTQTKQHGTIYIPLGEDDELKLLNREQRELHVLLTQQGESTAISGMLVSAAGKRFTDVIHAERAKYAQLVDFSQD